MRAALRATFVRSAGERDRIYVTRSDGSEVSWPFPTYGDGLPHDLVHLVVEACCGLRGGFWGRVDSGADPGRVNAEANRAGGQGKYAAFGPDQADLQVAETLAGAPWRLEGASHEQITASISAQCDRLGVPVPDLSAEQTQRIRSALVKLKRRWRGLGPKGSLSLTFQPDRPEESLQVLSSDSVEPAGESSGSAKLLRVSPAPKGGGSRGENDAATGG
jgi:hypothetical protein